MKKYILVGTLVASMLMPMFAGAATTAELQAMINSLMAQVKQLQAQLLDQQGGGTTPWCHTFEKNIGVGSRGVEVSHLTQALGRSGGPLAYGNDERGSVDDILFNEGFASAVTGFQEKYRSEILTPNGLKNGTGYVGPATRKKLNKLYGCNGNTPLPIIYSTSTSPLTVITPNGGEAWQIGSNNVIKWSGGQRPSTASFFITTYSTGGMGGGDGVYNLPIGTFNNSGSYPWRISSDIPNGQYSLKVCVDSVCDQSDSPFTIVNNGVLTSDPILSSSSSKQWSSVTYGNGIFVAVTRTCNSVINCNGEDSYIMTSPDAINWTLRSAAANNSWSSVTYGNGLFVAVSIDGAGHQVMTSLDGINWTIRNTPGNYSWGSITYGNNLFLAVSPKLGTTIGAMTSSDGINWTVRQTPNQFTKSVTYGNGLFVAVEYRTSSGRAVIYSSDGINWNNGKTPDIPYHFDYDSVTFGNGIFVAMPNLPGYVMTSLDGINWTIRNTLLNSSFSSVTYGNGLFVAVARGNAGHQVMTSPDGINWTIRNTPANNSWYSVTYGNGLFVAVSIDGAGHQVMTSLDGINWTSQSTP